jgi:hypothetical protein
VHTMARQGGALPSSEATNETNTLADDLADRIALADHPDEIEGHLNDAWVKHTHGRLTVDEYKNLQEAGLARMGELENPQVETRPKPRQAPSHSPRAAAHSPRASPVKASPVGRGGGRPRQPRSPERQRRLNRKRRLAASGPLPPALASRYTEGERAVLRIVGDDCRDKGCCTDSINEIAARAGVRRTTVQNTLRTARRPEERMPRLIDVRQRRRHGEKSLTNVIRIVSAEWRLWLTKGGGFKKSNTAETMPVQNRNHPGPMGIGPLWQQYSKPYDPGSESDPRWRRKRADAPSRREALSR